MDAVFDKISRVLEFLRMWGVSILWLEFGIGDHLILKQGVTFRFVRSVVELLCWH